MADVLAAYRLALYQRFDQLFLIPLQYLDGFQTLPYAYIGMPLGRWLDGLLEPSPEFFSRFGGQFTRGKLTIHDEAIAQWVAGRDIRHPDTTVKPQGQYLLVTDSAGRNLGMGKLLPKRLRNMLPR
jgi:NOL1/NOP2/fmu family ribosome biogenesis protein